MRVAIFVAVIGIATAAVAQSSQIQSSQVMLKTGAGNPAGSVGLTEAPGGLLMKVDLSGLTPGWHAIHLHEKGDCSDAAFKSAGAHTHAATPAVHGLLNPQANDTGDLPNVYAAADGTAKAELFTTLVSLSGAKGRANLKDTDGSAIVVHAKPDDFQTQPIGGSGDRVACGVVR